MKTTIIALISVILPSIFVFTSCKKTEEPSISITNSDQTISEDQTVDSKNMDDNVNEAINNVNDNVGGSSGGRLAVTEKCGYSVSTLSGSGLGKGWVFTFDNSSCLGRKRTGTITVELIKGDSYKQIGAQWKITYAGYAITKSGKTISIDGVHTVTNVSGGMAGSVLYGETAVIHLIRGNMTIGFDTTKLERVWSIARKTTWASVGGVLSMTIEGDTTTDGYSNLILWGENRFGNKFYTQLPTAYVINSTCGIFRPVSGERKHSLYYNNEKTLITTEKLLDSDNDGCSDTYQLTIDKNGKTKMYTFIF